MVTINELRALIADAYKNKCVRPILADALFDMGRVEDADKIRDNDSPTLHKLVWSFADTVPHRVLRQVVVHKDIWTMAGFQVANWEGELFAYVDPMDGKLDKALLIAVGRGLLGLEAVGTALDIVRQGYAG